MDEPKKFEEKQFLEKPNAVPTEQPGIHVWEENVQINCSTPGCTSTKTIKVERSNHPNDPAAIFVNDMKKLGRCHCCLDSTLTNMTDDPEDEELYYLEWEGYIGNKYNKCTCPNCLIANPGRRFVSAGERTLTKLWKERGLTDEEITERLKKRDAKAPKQWALDPNKSNAENMEGWQAQQQEQMEQTQIALQDRNKLFGEAVKNKELDPNNLKGSFKKLDEDKK
jgi:hypothetical protein